MSESVLGVRGKDFVIIASDTYSIHSILKLKENDDKTLEIDGNKILALSGELGDRLQFGEYIQKNIHLQRMRNHGDSLTTKATANFIRTEVSENLRKGPIQADLLLGGLSPDGTGELYRIDWLGCLIEAPKVALGYAAYLTLGYLDRHFNNETASVEEALESVKVCLKELSTRFLLSQSKFQIKIITKGGIRTELMSM